MDSCVMDYEFLNYFLKPSVVGIMVFYSLTLNSKKGSTYKYFMASGFFFSVMGDILLLFKGLEFFLFGLISFALAHISFSLAYLKNFQFDLKQFSIKAFPLIILNTVIGRLMFIYLTNLPDFKAFMVQPLAFYIILISMNCILASLRKATSQKSYLYGLLGGYLFVASDSILSLNVFAGFNHPIILFLIMFTYYLSEYCILLSTVYHLNYEIE